MGAVFPTAPAGQKDSSWREGYTRAHLPEVLQGGAPGHPESMACRHTEVTEPRDPRPGLSGEGDAGRLGRGLGAGFLESPGVSLEERGGGEGGANQPPPQRGPLAGWGETDIKSSEASLPASQDGGIGELDIPREGRG